MPVLLKVTDATFEQEVLKAELPVVVFFWAPWCGPCRMIMPILGELVREHADKGKWVEVNTDENPAATNPLKIDSIPTLVFFLKGREVGRRLVGFRPKTEIERVFMKVLQAGKATSGKLTKIPVGAYEEFLHTATLPAVVFLYHRKCDECHLIIKMLQKQAERLEGRLTLYSYSPRGRLLDCPPSLLFLDSRGGRQIVDLPHFGDQLHQKLLAFL